MATSGAQEAAKPAAEPVTRAAAEAVSAEVAAAESAIGKNDWKKAETGLNLWLATHSDDARALFDAGYVADAQGRLEDAVGLYRRAAEANPDSFEAHTSLGLLLARQGKFAEARPELDAATKLDPGEAKPEAKAQVWRALARVDREADPAQASGELLEALKLSKETEADSLLAAELAEHSGQIEAAENAYKRILVKDPNSVVAVSGIAHLLIARKQFPEAEAMLSAALGKSPSNPALTAQLAAVLAAQDKGEALPLLEKLHTDHPADTAVTRMLAEVRAEAGDATGSDALLVELLAQTPDDAGLLVAHGQNLIRLLKYAESTAVFEKATQRNPANADAWSGLAFAELKAGQPQLTLHALTERAKLTAELPATLFLWAMAYDTLHNHEQAATYYHQFLNAAAGKFPDQEWQARQRLLILEKKSR